MTLDDLAAFGANVDEGLERCMGMEAFYLGLVESVKREPGFDTLREALAAGNLDAAFEASHALKGVLGNLALTPLYEPMSELCELLRPRQAVDRCDYAPLLDEVLRRRDELAQLG